MRAIVLFSLCNLKYQPSKYPAALAAVAQRSSAASNNNLRFIKLARSPAKDTAFSAILQTEIDMMCY